MPIEATRLRNLVLVLGDQLSETSPALAGFDPARDAVAMIEAPGEAAHVWSTKSRIAVFFTGMRHHAAALRERGWPLHYVSVGDEAEAPTLPERLAGMLARLRPQRLRLVEPGEWRLQEAMKRVAHAAGVELQLIDDTHFLCSRADFARYAGEHGRNLRMEFFYREMRKHHRILMDAKGKPEGGRWNFDAENRKGFPKSSRSGAAPAGPGAIAPAQAFPPDAITRGVIVDVETHFAEHPGTLDDFAWPACRADALRALEVFVTTRLPRFGDYQDAMWTATPFAWHSLLSSSLNLHLLDPREVIAAAEAAYRSGDAPLAAVEGFVRQILGWREFIRGDYWQSMPQLYEANHLKAARKLPAWYWTGETKMVCMREAIGQTLRYGYAHHIQRLMVTGVFGLLAEIEPKQVADWYLAVYVDAVEWAELPNVVSMALYADGGRYVSKPYAASGAYIDRMSNYCGGCSYAPTPADALKRAKPLCPFTVLFWHFIDRHRELLKSNPRMQPMVRNLDRFSPAQLAESRAASARLLDALDTL